ncbi:MAG: autotransporter domain-containing protein, partial [Rickettsiaceae bacterium]|nr:autotransporter domain-containing protein [Rickettsiaceae bacterium]
MASNTTLDLGTNTLTLSNGGVLTASNACDIKFKLSSLSLYGKIVGATENINGSTLNITIDTSDYTPELNDVFQLFDNPAGTPNSVVITDTSYSYYQYAYVNGAIKLISISAVSVADLTTHPEVYHVKTLSSKNLGSIISENTTQDNGVSITTLVSNYNILKQDAKSIVDLANYYYINNDSSKASEVLIRMTSNQAPVQDNIVSSNISCFLSAISSKKIAEKRGRYNTNESHTSLSDAVISSGEENNEPKKLWTDFSFAESRHGATSNIIPFKSNNTNFTIGYDFYNHANRNFGIFGGFSISNTKFTSAFYIGNNIKSNIYSAGFYGNFDLEFFYTKFSGILSQSVNHYQNIQLNYNGYSTIYSKDRTNILGANIGLGSNIYAKNQSIIVNPEVNLYQIYTRNLGRSTAGALAKINYYPSESSTTDSNATVAIIKNYNGSNKSKWNIDAALNLGVSHKLHIKHNYASLAIKGYDNTFRSTIYPIYTTSLNMGAKISIKKDNIDYSAGFGIISANKFISKSFFIRVKTLL